MIWIGLVVGIVVGGAIDGWSGAFIGGFLGWLAGVIIKSRNEARKGPAPVAMPAAIKETVEVRVQRLEKTVARLEARLAKLAPEEELEEAPSPLETEVSLPLGGGRGSDIPPPIP